MKRPFVMLIIAMGMNVSSLSLTRGQAIYTDQFTGTGDLNGQAPTVASGILGGSSDVTWFADSGPNPSATFTESGGLASTDGYTQAELPFTPESGEIYDLSTNLQIPIDSTGDGLEIGYESGQNPGEPGRGLDWNGEPYVLLAPGNPTGTLYAYQNSPAEFTSPVGSIGAVLTTNALIDIRLDTTHADWSVSYFLNGAEFASYTYSGNPGIGYVGISNYFLSNGSFSNFSLQAEAVPEPSNWALGLGLTVVLLSLWSYRTSDGKRDKREWP